MLKKFQIPRVGGIKSISQEGGVRSKGRVEGAKGGERFSEQRAGPRPHRLLRGQGVPELKSEGSRGVYWANIEVEEVGDGENLLGKGP